MRMSDAITAYILRMMETETGDTVEICRNELAGEIGCVPSQITYVLSSRFTPENGYVVESRRGGGGYVRVRRIAFRSEISMLTHVVNSIGESLIESAAVGIIQNLLDRNILQPQATRAMCLAVSDRSYRAVPVELRDTVRADVMKHMLTAIALSE